MYLGRGTCIVYTAQWSGNSNLVLSGLRFSKYTVGAAKDAGLGGRAGPQTTQLTACRADKQ